MRVLRAFGLAGLDSIDAGLDLVFESIDLLRLLEFLQQLMLGVEDADIFGIVDILHLDIALGTIDHAPSVGIRHLARVQHGQDLVVDQGGAALGIHTGFCEQH